MTGVVARTRRARAVVATVVAATVVVLAGCSSGSTTKTSATTTGGSSSSTTTAGGGTQSDDLSSFASSVKSGAQSTFKAEYSYSGSSSGTITIEQKPPKSKFIAGGGEVIGTGSATYYCSTAGATPTCVSTGTANPMTALTQLFSPENVVTAIQQAEAQVAAHAQGYNVSFSNESFGGVDAKCVTISGTGQTGKYCVTKGGILAYSGSGSSNFMLTSFSTSVSDSDFALPAGASTITVPGAP